MYVLSETCMYYLKYVCTFEICMNEICVYEICINALNIYELLLKCTFIYWCALNSLFVIDKPQLSFFNLFILNPSTDIWVKNLVVILVKTFQSHGNVPNFIYSHYLRESAGLGLGSLRTRTARTATGNTYGASAYSCKHNSVIALHELRQTTHTAASAYSGKHNSVIALHELRQTTHTAASVYSGKHNSVIALHLSQLQGADPIGSDINRKALWLYVNISDAFRDICRYFHASVLEILYK